MEANDGRMTKAEVVDLIKCCEDAAARRRMKVQVAHDRLREAKSPWQQAAAAKTIGEDEKGAREWESSAAWWKRELELMAADQTTPGVPPGTKETQMQKESSAMPDAVQAVERAIRAAKHVCYDKIWNAWANRWLSGASRTAWEAADAEQAAEEAGALAAALAAQAALALAHSEEAAARAQDWAGAADEAERTQEWSAAQATAAHYQQLAKDWQQEATQVAAQSRSLAGGDAR